MGRMVRFIGVLSLLSTGAVALRPEIPEAQQIAAWPAPPYWTPPAVREPGEARVESVSTASAPLPFIAISPCRQYDSRNFAALPDNTPRSVTLTLSPCGIPATAMAVSANITVFDITGAGGNGVFWVSTSSPPTTAWINYPPSETQRANAGVVPLNGSGQIVVQVNQGAGSVDFIVDVNGYYDGSGALQLGLSRRAALDQFWTPQTALSLGMTTLGGIPDLCRSDGADVWTGVIVGNTVQRVRASDGKLLATWTGASGAHGVLVAMGKIFVTGEISPGALYSIDPTQAAGAVTTVASNLGNFPFMAAFDGSLMWTANQGGSVSIVTPGASPPWSVTTVSTGFSNLWGILFDGANIWVTDNTTGKLFKLDGAGAILQTVTVGAHPGFPIFDGTNIWVPNGSSNSVSVIRASTGAVVATLTGNGLNDAKAAAFDGTRVLVTNAATGANSVSLWRASDFTPLGSFGTGTNSNPWGACSDGINFWVTLQSSAGQLAKF